MTAPDVSFFERAFHALTGHQPFLWQEDFFRRLIAGEALRACNIPTGLGKTAIIAIWLIALAHEAKQKVARRRIPRRLVYVVNRRAVVDQSTTEAEQIRERLNGKGQSSNEDRKVLEMMKGVLCELCAGDDADVPAISTLRGQFADNREWSADPARPAIIVGTVDMIGSRLLFSGYGVGFKAKPLHAGFLGQDALLVHDEAHLEPAFQMLLAAIEEEQNRGRTPDRWPLRIMELTATSRANGSLQTSAGLTDEERNPPDVVPDPPTRPLEVAWRRLTATKKITFTAAGDRETVAERIGKLAKAYAPHEAKSAVLVFVNSLKDHAAVCKALKGEAVQVLTGTLRGQERDRMAKKDPVFARFSPRSQAEARPGTVYLVCTSAGEVGIDISADHMVCDLTAYDRMVQRFGRVNRFGAGEANIDVVHEARPDAKKADDPREQSRWRTLELLKELPPAEHGFLASPLALMRLRQREDLRARFEPACSPLPAILPVTDILFDAWALTSVRDRMPGRPPVAPYLHGLAEWEPPETHVAWREEVAIIKGDLLDRYAPEDLLEDYPLKPHELLRDHSERVLDQLQLLAVRRPDATVWVLDEQGAVLRNPAFGRPWTLAELADPSATTAPDKKRLIARIEGRTVLLPPEVGGLSAAGMLDGQSSHAADVSSDMETDSAERRLRVWSGDEASRGKIAGMRLVRSIELPREDDADEDPPTWDWYKHKSPEDARTAQRPVLWHIHVGDVVRTMEGILARLSLPEELTQALRVAARLHDDGKRRRPFQYAMGNRMYPDVVLAKSGGACARLPETYRHEFGSLGDAQGDSEFRELAPEMQALVLHLIAASHGRARPHFPANEAFDPEPKDADLAALAAEVPRRFARLQRAYGRWGLAYLESLLRAADWAASAEPSQFVAIEKELTQ